MKELEITILPQSRLENLQTLGSEYYLRRFVSDQDRLRSSGFRIEPLSAICTLITDGDHGVADYQPHGVPFILSENVREGWIDTSGLRRISEAHHRSLRRSQIRAGDVLVTKTGVYFGKSAVVDDQLGEANTIAHVGVLRPRTGVSPYLLSAFLNGRYGQSQLRRRGIKATRPEIKLVELQGIETPLLSENLARAVEEVMLRAKKIRQDSDRAVEQASTDFLIVLGLEDWVPPERLTYMARASDVLGAARLDAQYFRSVFDDVQARLAASGRAVTLGSILSVNARGRQPLYDAGGLPVINSKHVRINRVIVKDNRTAPEAGSTVVIEGGDVLLNGTGVGTIGRAAAYLHPQRALPDNHVTVLRTDRVDPVYLAAFLNSPLGRMQIERHIRGSSGQIELYPGDIARIVIWDAPPEVQAAVRVAITNAYQEERRANALLKLAKHTVDAAIEDGEIAALASLESALGAI